MLRYKKYNTDILFDLVLVCVPIAIVGLRLHFVIFDVLATPGRTLGWWFQDGRIFGFYRNAEGNLRFGGLAGLAIYGGLIAGASAAFLGKKLNDRKFAGKPHKQMNILQIYDVFFILIILGQVIGRWGNFANMELYGAEIIDPSRQWFPLATRIYTQSTRPDGTVVRTFQGYFQALFFYESFFNLIGFAFMAWMFFGKRRSFDGAIFAFYCIWYGTLRTILEPMRQDGNIMRVWNGGPPVNIVISVGILLLGVGIVVMHIYKTKNAGKRLFLFVKKDNLSEEYYGYDKTIEYLLKNVKEEPVRAGNGGRLQGNGFSFSEEGAEGEGAAEESSEGTEEISGGINKIDDDQKQFID